MTVYISEGAELLPWSDPDWRREVEAWIDARLQEIGLHRTDDIVQVYARSWSTVLRAPTDGGVLFFKASSPTQAMEVPLVKALATWSDNVVAPLASDEERGWMLMRDAGARLRELPAKTDIALWKTIVTQYAQLQLAVTTHVEALLALGVRDLRLDRLPDRFAELLADEDLLLLGREGGLTRNEHARLREWQPDLRGLCTRLASYGIPDTIEHSDLHSANLFVDRGRVFFFDWGDAAISHPFQTLRVTLSVVSNTLEVGRDDPSVNSIRDAYLTEFGEPATFREAFDLAQRTGLVADVLVWAPYVKAMLPVFAKRYERSVPDGAREILGVI